jgi:hypothetical protein
MHNGLNRWPQILKMKIELVIIGAFFCYGWYTLQRPNFLLHPLTKLWKKFPKSIHEPLYSCGVCVSSIWGGIFIISQYLISAFVPIQYQLFASIPFYLVAMCGLCALVDRAVKFFEYGYKYTGGIISDSNYSYLNKFEFRDKIYDCFLQAAIEKDYPVIEIGGKTENLTRYPLYQSLDKKEGNDVINTVLPRDKFVLVKGLCFVGNFDHLLGILQYSKGFIIESSIAGESGKQIQWILDKFDGVIKMNYSISNFGVTECPDHCDNNVNNRIILIQPIN